MDYVCGKRGFIGDWGGFNVKLRLKLTFPLLFKWQKWLMRFMTYLYNLLPVERISLRLDNPRFPNGEVDGEPEAIEKLCSEFDILGLAKDISEVGLNPMDIAGVVKVDKKNYWTGEGNRRFCAIKLLNDPERAPSSIKKRMKELAENAEFDFDKVYCCVFDEKSEMDIFIQRMHSSSANGTRRLRWSPEAQEREFETGKYAVAVAVTDFARENQIYKDGDTEIALSTLQRWVNKPASLSLLGISKSPEGFVSFKSRKDVIKALKKLFSAINAEENPSRRNKGYIEAIALRIQNEIGVQKVKKTPKPLTSAITAAQKSASKIPRKPPSPPTIKTIPHNEELHSALSKLGHLKLSSLYYSLTNTKLDNNVPMLTITAWSLLECLAKLDGATGDFIAHFNKNWFATRNYCKLAKRDEKFKSYHDALSNISKKGNATKHAILSGGFDKFELATDMQVLSAPMVTLVNELLGPSP